MGETVWIVKEDGEREPFSREKLVDSLTRAGANGSVAEEITAHVEGKLTDGMTTTEIYRHAFRHLKKEELPVAARYSLKRALLSLGPTGFPFEEFLKELLHRKGYSTETGVRVCGACVEHEVDVVACHGGNTCRGIEAKFHNSLGIKSDLKVALYVDARFRDITQAHETSAMEDGRRITEGWLITNTKFTKDAIQYAECAHLALLGWNYPHDRNLQDEIEAAGVHPVTCLTSLSKKEKQKLLENNIVLCESITKNAHLLKEQGVSDVKIKKALEESQKLCN